MEHQKSSARHKPLSLIDLSSAFVVLGLGTSLAALIFLIELFYKRINDYYFNPSEDRQRELTAIKTAKKVIGSVVLKANVIAKIVLGGTVDIKVAEAVSVKAIDSVVAAVTNPKQWNIFKVEYT